MNYFQAVKQNEGTLPDVLKHFEEEYALSKDEVKLHGKGSLTQCVCEISSNYEKRLEQLQEVDAILKHFEIKLNQKKSEMYKKYLENYQRSLSSSDIKVYIDGVPEVVALQQIINEITLIRNKYLGLTKSFETANYQLSNLSKLYAAGVDGVII